MDKLPLVARILLGLLFVVTGLNGFFNFMPEPELGAEADSFMGALMDGGYFWAFLKTTELVCGILLLLGRFVPLALTILAPVVLNIITFHLVLDPAGIALAAVALVLEVFLAYSYRGSYKVVLKAIAQPG